MNARKLKLATPTERLVVHIYCTTYIVDTLELGTSFAYIAFLFRNSDVSEPPLSLPLRNSGVVRVRKLATLTFSGGGSTRRRLRGSDPPPPSPLSKHIYRPMPHKDVCTNLEEEEERGGGKETHSPSRNSTANNARREGEGGKEKELANILAEFAHTFAEEKMSNIKRIF